MNNIDKRKKTVAIIAHCILNQNTIVKPLASHEGVVKDILNVLINFGYGIIQLPCPEAIYLGLNRWWMSREQFDVKSYKEFSRELLKPYIKLLEEIVKDGCKYIVIGVQGSPSCALIRTTSNQFWGGEPRADLLPASIKIDRPGVFMEVFLELIKEVGLPQPLLILDVSHKEIAEKGLPIEIREKLAKVVKQ